MTSKRFLGNRQREVLLEWIEDRQSTFTIKDVEEEYNIHYQTAFNWVRTLETEGLVQVSGKAGRTNIYQACAPVGGFDQESMNARALRVRYGSSKKELSVAEWASSRANQMHLRAVCGGMLYLFVRSYYYDSPDHQHLRGVATPLEVRATIEKILEMMEYEANVVRQLLSLRAPWIEGPSLALRFGNPVGGFDMPEAMALAHSFQRDVLGNKDSEEETS